MNELVHFNRAKQELALATRVDEVKEIRDRAEALRVYIKQTGEGLVMQNQCAEIKIRAERRAGELIPQQISQGGDPKLHDVTLKDLSISNIQSFRWQQIADIPGKEFEKHIATTKESGKELTSIGVQKLAKQVKKGQRSDDIIEQAKGYKPDPLIEIVHGDVLVKSELIQDASIDLLLTDPPYGVMTDYKWDSVDSQFLDDWLSKISPKLKPNFLGFIFCDSRRQFDFEGIIRRYFSINNRIIWVRKNMSLGRVIQNRFISAYETIFFFGNKGLNLPSQWGKERFDVKEYATPQSNFAEGKDHPTQKPLELIKELVRLGSIEGEAVLDPFAGSGTTVVACKQLKRSCIAIEKEEEYINVIKARLNDL